MLRNQRGKNLDDRNKQIGLSNRYQCATKAVFELRQNINGRSVERGYVLIERVRFGLSLFTKHFLKRAFTKYCKTDNLSASASVYLPID